MARPQPLTIELRTHHRVWLRDHTGDIAEIEHGGNYAPHVAELAHAGVMRGILQRIAEAHKQGTITGAIPEMDEVVWVLDQIKTRTEELTHATT